MSKYITVRVILENDSCGQGFRARFMYDFKKGSFCDADEIGSPIVHTSKTVLAKKALDKLQDILKEKRFVESSFSWVDETHFDTNSKQFRFGKYLDEMKSDKGSVKAPKLNLIV